MPRQPLQSHQQPGCTVPVFRAPPFKISCHMECAGLAQALARLMNTALQIAARLALCLLAQPSTLHQCLPTSWCCNG